MNVWVVADSVVSPLGFTSDENFNKLSKDFSGICAVRDTTLSPGSFFAAQISGLSSLPQHTKFETICLKAAQVALDKIAPDADRTIYILSTTKGNISLLAQEGPEDARVQLHHTAQWLSKKAGYLHSLVVSNACVSGVLALIVGRRLLLSGKYDHAVVVGGDVLSHFVVSGFQSLLALSPEPCRPFDAGRKGINLGEAAAAIVLSCKPDKLGVRPSIKITGGGVSNDANHISGPSRTGDELALAIKQALAEADKRPQEIDFISAHGTATLFNDEMEAKAFDRVGMSRIPTNSLKGYFGHTLGAAGMVETVMSIRSLLNDRIPKTKGFDKLGVSRSVNVTREHVSKPVNTCLKTSSGFGGCNAAIIIEKENNTYN